MFSLAGAADGGSLSQFFSEMTDWYTGGDAGFSSFNSYVFLSFIDSLCGIVLFYDIDSSSYSNSFSSSEALSSLLTSS